MKTILLYLPVIHRGYLEFLNDNRDAHAECLLLGRQALLALGDEAKYMIRKDHEIRGIPEEMACGFVQRLGLFRRVQILYPELHYDQATHIVAPDEDVSVLATERFFPGVPVTFDGSVRLRYDRKGVERLDPVPENALVTADEAHRELMGQVETEAIRSNDWWLHVGALVAKDGKPLIIAHNRTVPEGITGALGDPRSIYTRGQGTDDTLADHAERQLVSRAAFLGLSLQGTDAYVTHFPCVPCAESLADAGVKRLFFRQGYSRLESASVLSTKGVEIYRVA